MVGMVDRVGVVKTIGCGRKRQGAVVDRLGRWHCWLREGGRWK